jgi:uncharacterized protein YodC (DUF2158 family)
MRSKNEFAIAAGLALVLSLPSLHSAVSASDLSTAKIASPLHQGDLVRLRSGGPLMTVNEVKDDQVECVWTDTDGQPDDATFPVAVLQKY